MKTIILIALALACVIAVRNTSQSSMQSTGPADVLLEHLGSIQTDIRTEQFEHDTLYNTQHAECEEEFTARTTAIVDGEDALYRAEAHHARCDAAQMEASADLAQVRAYEAEINGNVQGLTLKRQTQATNFNTLVQDELMPAISAVQGAYPIIDSFSTGSASFLEVTRHMANSFKTMVKAGKGAQMAAPLAALVSLGQDFDQASIDEVRGLFERLEADLVAAITTATDIENNRIAVFGETIFEYNTILTNLAATAEQLIAYEADMAACVVTEAAIIEQASKKVFNNREALKYAIEMCSAFEEEYKNASSGRKAELELLEKLTVFIREQAEIFGDYGADQSGVLDAYKNQYEQQLNNQVSGFIQLRADKNKEHLARMQKALYE